MAEKWRKNALLVLFGMVFLGQAQAVETAPEKKQGDPLVQAQQLVTQHKWAEAEQVWRSLQGQVDPQIWHYNLGVILAQRGQSAQAAVEFEKALQFREPERTIWQALRQLRTHEARAAYAVLFKDQAVEPLRLSWLPATLNGQVADTLQAVRQALEGWRRAWMAQEVDAYLAFYAPDFRPASGLSHQAWVAQRRVRVRRPKFIDIQLSDITIEPLTQMRVATTFRQRYRSDRIADVVTKRLIWEKRGDGWVIVKEVILR